MSQLSTVSMRSVPEIVDALVSQLKLVKLDDGVTAAFDDVAKFDVEDIEEPFRLLLVSGKRAALVIPMDEQYETIVSQRELVSKRTLPVAILFSDFVYGDRQSALWGNSKTPGAYKLKDRSLPFVVGQLLDNPAGVVVRPTVANRFLVKSNLNKSLGRSAVAQELECRGGIIEAAYGLGPNL